MHCIFSTTFRGLAATATTGAALQTIDNLGQRQIEDSKDKEEKPSTNEGHDMVRRGTEEAIEVDEQGVAGEPGSIALVDDNNGEELYDLAHKFAEHTYRSPTNCDICHGLLVGLWSQGLQCEKCGVNCHRGEGIGDHDDCSPRPCWPRAAVSSQKAARLMIHQGKRLRYGRRAGSQTVKWSMPGN